MLTMDDHVTPIEVLEHLAKKLGRTPTQDDITKTLNGLGLVTVCAEIRKERAAKAVATTETH